MKYLVTDRMDDMVCVHGCR